MRIFTARNCPANRRRCDDEFVTSAWSLDVKSFVCGCNSDVNSLLQTGVYDVTSLL